MERVVVVIFDNDWARVALDVEKRAVEEFKLSWRVRCSRGETLICLC